MKKSIEEFARENRGAFDMRKIDEAVWLRIKKELKQPVRKRSVLSSLYFKWTAAAAILIIAVGILIYHFNKPGEIVGKTNTDIIYKQYPEFDSRIKSFASLIETKERSIKKIENEHPDIYSLFTQNLNVLKKDYENLEQELRVNPNKSVLLGQMMDNLELQVRLLTQQLRLINDYKESLKRKNEEATNNS